MKKYFRASVFIFHLLSLNNSLQNNAGDEELAFTLATDGLIN